MMHKMHSFESHLKREFFFFFQSTLLSIHTPQYLSKVNLSPYMLRNCVYECIEVQLHSFLTQSLDEVSSQLYAPVALTRERRPFSPSTHFVEDRWAVEPICTFWKRIKSFTSAGNRNTIARLSSLQPNHYADFSFPASEEKVSVSTKFVGAAKISALSVFLSIAFVTQTPDFRKSPV